MALSVDKYIASKTGKDSGDHDSIWKLEADGLISYIETQAISLPELKDIKFLENLLLEFPDN